MGSEARQQFSRNSTASPDVMAVETRVQIFGPYATFCLFGKSAACYLALRTHSPSKHCYWEYRCLPRQPRSAHETKVVAFPQIDQNETKSGNLTHCGRKKMDLNEFVELSELGQHWVERIKEIESESAKSLESSKRTEIR